VSRRVLLFLLVCICTGSLFAPHVCNSEQTRVLEQITVAWHEWAILSGRWLSPGRPKSTAHSFCIVPRGSVPWEAANFQASGVRPATTTLTPAISSAQSSTGSAA
jgi:hypothetical protein